MSAQNTLKHWYNSDLKPWYNIGRQNKTDYKVILGAAWRSRVNEAIVLGRKSVMFTVTCNESLYMRGCEASADIKIEIGKRGDAYYSQHEFVTDFNVGFQKEEFNFKRGKVFRNNVLDESQSFDESVFDSAHQFQVTIVVRSVNGPKFLRALPFNFRSQDSLHDKVLVMDDGRRFYVQSQVLSATSNYFHRLFNSNFAEASQDDIKIGGVNATEFETMLTVIHPFPNIIEVSSIGSLLRMADRFDIPELSHKCFHKVCSLKAEEAERMVLQIMKWADDYQILQMQDFAYKTLKNMDSLHDHIKKNEDEFNSLPPSTRELILYAFYLRDEQK